MVLAASTLNRRDVLVIGHRWNGEHGYVNIRTVSGIFCFTGAIRRETVIVDCFQVARRDSFTIEKKPGVIDLRILDREGDYPSVGPTKSAGTRNRDSTANSHVSFTREQARTFRN